MESTSARIPNPPAADAIAAHYALVAPIMERLFGRIPIVWTTYSDDPKSPRIFHQKFFGHYSHLSSEHLQHLAAVGAREFFSWFPAPQGDDRARFIRFLLERPGNASESMIAQGALALRTVLSARGYDTILVTDGNGAGDVALFLPIAGAPDFSNVRSWCHAVTQEAINAYPALFSEQPNTRSDGRVHVHVSSNAQGRFSIVPYSVRYATGEVAAPMRWDEVAKDGTPRVRIEDLPARLQRTGEVFGEQLLGMSVRPLPAGSQFPSTLMNPDVLRPNGYGAIIAAAVEVLSDGKSWSAEEIWKTAHERGLLKGKGQVQSFVSALDSYIQRRQIAGRKPIIVKTLDHKFRINEPPDLWPDLAVPAPQASPQIDAIIARLYATCQAKAATEFEVATCDAFDMLGFLATHLGGKAAPDGYGDAPLGEEGYRVMIECKSGASEGVSDVYEAAKFKGDYHGQYCMLFNAQSVSNQSATFTESKNHGVSLWEVDDMAVALRHRLTPDELEPAFAGGTIASDVLPDILWARRHGEAKRVTIIAQIIESVGLATQCAAAQAAAPADSPRLTEDAAMVIVDQELAAQGCHVNCAREEVRLAFEWLTNPRVGIAKWTQDDAAIIVVRARAGS